MKRTYQVGSAHVVVTVCLVVALVGALGWIFWQNVINKDKNVASDTTSKVVTDGSEDSLNPETTPSSKLVYQDFRTDEKDGSGIVVASEADTSKLTDAGVDLKEFFGSNAGKMVDSMEGKIAQTFTIDRLEGNYAVGKQSNVSAWTIWGPKDGTGKIASVAGAQNAGFACSELKAAKVPSKLVDGKCLASDGTGTVNDYKQD